MLRLVLLLFVIVSVFIVLTLSTFSIQLILTVTVKKINKYLYYKIQYYLVYLNLSVFVALFDWFSKSELHLYMDKSDYETYFGRESMYLISNHPSELDWVINVCLSEKAHLLGNTRFYTKEVLKHVPLVGWLMSLADVIFLARNFVKDKTKIEKNIQTLMSYPDNTFIIIMPEGTIFAEDKYAISQQYAEKNNLPKLKYHLTPRTKGFVTSFPIVQNKLKAIYDITITYKQEKPRILDYILGNKIVAHCFLKRIPMKDIPEDKNEFIHNLFVEKDQIVDTFHKTGDFNIKTPENQLVKIKLERNKMPLFCTIFIDIFSLTVTLIFLYKLIVNGYVWYIIISAVPIIFGILQIYKITCISKSKKQ